ncbi:MAG: nucleotide pyrophosphohydrolase [Chloroflexi bacterium]|nr:nucleotide pyrophosphohydrolase [Chloroflexota bacterium]
MQEKVKQFHEAYGLDDPPGPCIPAPDAVRLRLHLIEEEAAEFRLSSEAGHLADSIKELCDLLYVVLGAANAYGIDIEPFFDEVHRSNMTKLWPGGEVRKNALGKVIKPPTYSPADIERILDPMRAGEFADRQANDLS